MNTAVIERRDVAALLQIAGEVGELTQDLHVRRTHILTRLLGLVGGCWAVCSEMDPRHVYGSGWAMPDSITCAGTLSAYQQNIIDRYVTGKLAALDPSIPPLLRLGRRVATVRRGDVVDDSSWFGSDHHNLIRRPLGFGESMYGILTTPDGRWLKLSMHRELGDPAFDDRHVQLLQVFNENLAGLYTLPAARERQQQETGARAPNPAAALPQRLRPVLQCLLAGDAEKQAAMKLKLSPHTVHEYVKLLYRNFGVNSRGELLAKFVAESAAC
jgi:DNA-binding CsgD family transcriptional regulator